MTLRDFIPDFGNLLTGIITFAVTFAASSYYTNLQLEPGRNMSLVPHMITIDSVKEACIVDRNKLKDTIERLGSVKATLFPPTQTYDYELYLKALSSGDAGFQITKRNVPEELLPQLEKEGILNCNQQGYEYPPFTLQTAVLLDQPTAYLLERSCELVYEDAKIPIRASTSVQPLVPSTEPEQEMLAIRETRNLMFYYDMRKLNEEDERTKQAEFNKWLEGKHSVDLSIKCKVVDSEENYKSIGGKRYRVSVTLKRMGAGRKRT